jgi:hypothetical protein
VTGRITANAKELFSREAQPSVTQVGAAENRATELRNGGEILCDGIPGELAKRGERRGCDNA